MLNIALFEPEIPPNTGNIIRLCANTGAQLHLIHPLGFDMDTKALRRAGLDYHEFAQVREYQSYQEMLDQNTFKRVFAVTTKGTRYHHEFVYEPDDCLLLGPETRGLPDSILSAGETECIRVPMRPGSRSLNLSNTAAIVLYQALASQGYHNLE